MVYYIAIIALLCIVILAGFGFMIYNNLIRLRNNIAKAWSNIDVLMKKRHDIIGSLINVTKGYSKYESTLLPQLTLMRTCWESVKDTKDPKDKMATSNGISGNVKTLIADVENYPQLKADGTWLELQSELAQIENEIAHSREFYNDTVKIYNTNISVIPYKFIAKILKYRLLPYFPVPEGQKAPVNAFG